MLSILQGAETTEGNKLHKVSAPGLTYLWLYVVPEIALLHRWNSVPNMPFGSHPGPLGWRKMVTYSEAT